MDLIISSKAVAAFLIEMRVVTDNAGNLRERTGPAKRHRRDTHKAVRRQGQASGSARLDCPRPDVFLGKDVDNS